MPPPERDTRELKRILRSHSVKGYPVQVPIFGDAIALSSNAVLGRISYRVKPLNPIPFDQLAERLDWSKDPMDLKEWRSHLKSMGRQQPLTMIPPEIQDVLYEGGKASWYDVHRTWLGRSGCLEGGLVLCFDFDSGAVGMLPENLQPGMLVEFYDKTRDAWGWAGRIIGIEPKGDSVIVLLEVFEPVPAMDAPMAIDPSMIRPGFYSEWTWKIGYGTAHGFTLTKTPLPPGKWQQDPFPKRRLQNYLLDNPIPLSMIQEFCKAHYPDESSCVRQAMVFYILPLETKRNPPYHEGGSFRPLPELMAEESMVVDPFTYTGEEY